MSGKKHYIFSTLSSATTYTETSKGPADLPAIDRKVTINGKAGLADKRTLETPRGAVTSVSEEDLALLESNPVFQLHKKNGYVTVEDSNEDIDSVVADMNGRDPSAPLVPTDFPNLDADSEAARKGNQVGAPETTAGGKGGDKAKGK